MSAIIPRTPAATEAAARSLHDICEDTRRANCGQCWAPPGDECIYTTAPMSVPVTRSTPVRPVRGYHVARFSRAYRRGLITGPELTAALDTAGVFTSATVVYDETPGGAS